MTDLKSLFANNVEWADQIKAEDPQFFNKLVAQQNPEYLWIGCSDSRVPANEIVDLLPGELFVHRNVANVVVPTDMNCMSVMQFAVDVLKVKHIMVVGHYGCGGIRAVLQQRQMGLIDHWLRHVKDVYHMHADELQAIEDFEQRCDRLCDLNVIHQAQRVCQSSIVQEAWARGQELSVHGWMYSLKDGLLRDMDVCFSCLSDVEPIYRTALERKSKA